MKIEGEEQFDDHETFRLYRVRRYAGGRYDVAIRAGRKWRRMPARTRPHAHERGIRLALARRKLGCSLSPRNQ